MSVTTAMVKDLRERSGAGILDCKLALEASSGDLEAAVAYLRERGLAKAAKKADRDTQAGLVVVKQSADAVCAVELDCETDFVAFTDAFKTFAQRLADLVLSDTALTDVDSLLTAPLIDTANGTRQTVADILGATIGQVGENLVLSGVARYPRHSADVIAGYIHAGDSSGHYDSTEGHAGVIVALETSGKRGAVVDELAHDLALQITAFGARYLSPESIPTDVLDAQREQLIYELIAEDKPAEIKAKIVAGRLAKYTNEISLLPQPFLKDSDISVAEHLAYVSKQIGALIRIVRFTRFEVGT